MLGAITAALSAREPHREGSSASQPASPDLLMAGKLLVELEARIDGHDLAAVELLPQLAIALPPEAKEQLDRLRGALDRFDQPHALAVLREIMASYT